MSAGLAPVNSRRTWLLAGVLLGWTLLAYAPSLSNGFIWDDDGYVQGNLQLRSVEGLWRIWTVRGAVPQYYPLVHTTFWLEYHVWELWAPGFHIVNLILHVLNALLLWRVLWKLGWTQGAWLTAMLFAVHPLGVETVAWITERKNVLSCLFFLSAFLAYLNFTKANRWRWYTLALLCYVCALLCKTVTATWPAAMFLVLWCQQMSGGDMRLRDLWQRLPWRHGLKLIPFFVIGLSLSAITVSMEINDVGALGSAWNQTPVERFLIAGRVAMFYAHKIFWPDVFMFNYPRWTIDASQGWQFGFPALVVLIAGALWHWRGRLSLWPLAAWLFYLGSLLPASGFFDVYPMRFSFVADHFSYHASIGVIILLAGVLIAIFQRLPKWASRVLLVCLLGFLSLSSLSHARTFANPVTLWTQALVDNPQSWMAYNYRGVAWERAFNQTRQVEYLHLAQADYEKGLQLHQEFAQLHHNLASVLLKLGKPAQAIPLLERSIELQPDLPQGHYHLGLALDQTGEKERAIIHYTQAVKIWSGYVSAHHHLARLLVQKGNFSQAKAHFLEVIRQRPQSPAAPQELGMLLLKQGDYPAAAKQFRHALALAPNSSAVLWTNGQVAYLQGRTGEALLFLERALALKPTEELLKLELAWVLATCPQVQLQDRSRAVVLAQSVKGYPKKKARVLAAAAVDSVPSLNGVPSLISLNP